MKPSAEKLCGVPSNCAVCRQIPSHRAVIGWPDVCPRGYTADNLPRDRKRKGGCAPAPKPPTPPDKWALASMVQIRLPICRRCPDPCEILKMQRCRRNAELGSADRQCPSGLWPDALK